MMQQQQQQCVVCAAPCSVSTDPQQQQGPATCSLRCSWYTRQCCVQCGRGGVNSVFCSLQCQDESRRGNWCSCGVRQVAQGFARCSAECNAASPFATHASVSATTTCAATSSSPDHHQQSQDAMIAKFNEAQQQRTPADTPFPSRKTTPEEAQQRGGKPLRTCCSLAPGDKIFDRIVTPFARSNLMVHNVIQLNNAPADQKAYKSHRLAVDQRMQQNRAPKYALGGEGNEARKFVPILAGCAAHVGGAQTTADGTPIVCQDPQCDVCSILSNGLKLSATTGRSSHFCLPSLDCVLPWCVDAGTTLQDGYNTRVCAVALARAVVGVPLIVNSLNDVAPPPEGCDSVVLLEPTPDGAPPKSDQIFMFNDIGIQCEYIVLFSPPPPQQQHNY